MTNDIRIHLNGTISETQGGNTVKITLLYNEVMAKRTVGASLMVSIFMISFDK